KVTIDNTGKISGVAAGVEKTDAVNVGQLKDYVAANDTHIKSGNYAVGEVTDSTGNKSQGVSMDIVNKEGKVTGTVTITDVAKASDVGNVNNIASDIKNQDGSHTTVVDAVNNLNQKLDNKVGDLNYVEGGKGNYVTNGENTTTSIGKLDQALKDVAATAAKHTTVTQGDNITVTPGTNTDGGKNYNVALKKDITVESVTANTFKADQTVMNKDGLKVGNKVSVSATAVTAGKTSISDEGVKVGGKTYISDKGLNANDQKVTNVAAGELSATSKDAVNGSQLYETKQAIANNATNISSLSHSISNLDNRVNKVGAGAAALAALHPLDFDPDAKWDFAAGYGNYRGANAAAVGAYYRPNEDTMFSVGGTFGNGENMVNAGVSFKLGSGSSHVSTSRVAMAKEIKELRGELEAMKSAMLDANAGKKIDTSKLQLFPDVPQNHWAYEYVAQLAGNGMIEGYPDGNFAGDRPMTRYEFAAILYRAMTKGAVLSDKILSEFSHELEYFTVDTIAKDKAGNPTIQRVRTVKENKNK
ncbi:S-layer homology domain-containing protein, partial [Megasphaera elsdenii]|uniref:S-layer homology domain-containing protein n=1 Tax=Megasphaera elsdenii TaxID=907 RepID=UPI0009139402